jgi:hypothetical protein
VRPDDRIFDMPSSRITDADVADESSLWVAKTYLTYKQLILRVDVGGGERMGHFGGPQGARPPGVEGGEDVASPAKVIQFFLQ